MRWWPSLLLLLACSDYDLIEHEEPKGGDSDPPVDSEPPHDSEPVPGSCDEHEPPEPYDAGQDETCYEEAVWTPGSFDPVVEWQWSTNPTGSGFDHIMAAPAIGNVTDDNADGLVDEADIPDIVFTTFAGSAYTAPGALNLIAGDGSGTFWSKTDLGGYHPYSSGGVAIADLDADGRPEILVAGVEAAVLVVDSAGDLIWAAGSATSAYGCPAVADMDGDGLAEVIFGHQIFDHQGNLLGQGTHGVGAIYMSFAVDMDADGQLEVVAGNAVYEMDGSDLWYNGESDGIPAVADFDRDGAPEVVTVNGGYITLVDNDGTRIWQSPLPGGGSGGAPTVADFDGDGAPEVGVAGLGAYTMFDTDGSVVWSNPTEDDSSSRTGSAVFDFEGDGVSEVVYADEHDLYVYSGPDGSILLDMADHASGTLMEYPLIADVDNDGSTEIVVASNDYTIAGWQGITVIGDLHGSWAPARPVWNQYAYHITNVESDAGVPVNQEPNWRSWNNFRAAGSEQGPPTWKADLAFGRADLCTEECGGEDHVLLWQPVENRGLVDAGSFMVRIYQTGGEKEVMIHSQTVAGLAAGESTVLGPITIDREAWGPGVLTVRLDEPDAVAECDHQVNERDLGTYPCP